MLNSLMFKIILANSIMKTFRGRLASTLAFVVIGLLPICVFAQDSVDSYSYSDVYGAKAKSENLTVEENFREGLSLKPFHREPSSICLSADGRHLFVANKGTGSVTIVVNRTFQVIDEISIGRSLTQIKPIHGTEYFLAVDHTAHKMHQLHWEDGKLEKVAEINTSQFPLQVAIAANGQIVVSCLWSRRVDFFRMDEGFQIDREQTVDLEIAPREIVFVGEGTVVAADAYKSLISVIDSKTFKQRFQNEYPGHNIRGFAIAATGELVSACQSLNDLAHTVRNDIHWGLLMSNDLRWADVSKLIDPKSDIFRGAMVQSLGRTGNAMGDPTNVVVHKSGLALVTVGGVDEVTVGKKSETELTRIKVGDFPTSACIDAEGELAFVTNAFDSSISVVDLKKRKEIRRVSLGPSPKLTNRERGKRLFFDARLAHDGWLSCNSCHGDGHTNGQLNDNFSDGSFDSPKRVMTLLGKSESTLPLAWNGKVESFEDQVRNSIEKTMQSPQAAKEGDVEAIAAFIKTLPAPPGINVARGTVDPDQVASGLRLFNQLNCSDCHSGSSFTSPEVFDVGLADEQSNTKFNPPSLLGVSQRGPYFHDGRSKTLREVLTKFKHQISRDLTSKEVEALLAFLRSI